MIKTSPAKLLFFLLLASISAFSQSPNVASIDTIQGPVNSVVGISGSNFSTNSGNLSVWFGATKGNILLSTDNFIEVSVPAGTSTSAISVTNKITGLSGFSSKIFNLNYSGAGSITDFTSQELKDFDPSEELFDLTVHDFDLDGLNDVAASKIGESSQEIIIYHNNSTGNTISFNLLNRITNPEFDIKNPTSNITSGDIDGDGKPDLVATRSGTTASQIYVWHNISTPGNIKFANQKSFFINAGEIAKFIRIRDIDGDGKPELIISNNENSTISIFQNISSIGNINFNFQDIEIDVPGATSTNGLAVEDINGDGKPEIITNPLFESNVYILENTSTKGNFNFSDPIVLNLSGNLNSLIVGDMNRDGLNDIVITKTQESKIAVFLNNTTTNISFEAAKEFDSGLRPWGLDLGDINGDGALDIITTSINSNVATYFENKSTDALLDFDIVVIPQTLKSRNVIIADLSGDGKPDIALTSFDFPTDEFRLSTVRITNCFVATILDAPESICNTQTLRLNATQGLFVDYIWKKDGIEVKNSMDSFLDITQPGTYSVTASSESSSCAESSQDFVVLLGTGGIPPDIANTVNNDGPVCPEQNVNLSIDTVAGATYEWSGPNNFSSTDQNPVLNNVTASMAGNYIATVFLGDCRSVAASTLVEVLAPPDFTIQASGNTDFCEGNSVILSVNSETGFTYQWLKDNIAIPAATTSNYTVIEAGIFSVEVSSSTANCSINTEPVTVTTFLPPEASFSFSGTQCVSNEIQFTDESTIINSLSTSYLWDFGDGTTSTEVNPVHTFPTSQDFIVTLNLSYDGQNCSDSQANTITISAPTPFTINVAGNTAFCIGETTTLSVDGNYTTYSWSTGEDTSEITVSDAGTYSVIATNAAGCSFQDQIDITVFDLPIIEIISDTDIIIQGDSVQLEAVGAINYSWSPGITLNDSTISDPIAFPLTTTIYNVLGVDLNGCIGESSITITVDESSVALELKAPKLFSPNGDTIDDEWVIENIDDFSDCQLVIFSRGGTTVYEAQPYTNDWNGMLNGEELAEGAYYYIISCPDGKNNTGSISIIR